MTEPNYFTCTLGQAIAHNKNDSFTNINDFIEQQAKAYPDSPAAGFYCPASESTAVWQCNVLSFKEILSRSIATAEDLSRSLRCPDRQVVALLCPSTVEFMFTWLGLMRLGHSVLLVAPQCSPVAVGELCKQCNARNLFYDGVYEQLAEASRTEAGQECPLELHFLPDVFTKVDCPVPMIERQGDISKDDIAYLHHTSGTSSGIPKPIPQSHNAGAGVCPRLDGSSSATFTTTPLYHGGIADLFRAWTSRALIWFFPSKDAPITAANVIHCLKAASKTQNPPIKYFSSVPYVLQIMAADNVGLQYLQSMDIVGVGGAALPKEVGDQLVDQGVHLASRFGSAECGFLMSSHRDYKNDKAWQYLRPRGDGALLLKFEAREKHLFELVVLRGWPHMAKTNREDHSFATSDLFEQHPDIPDAWRYHSRADSQLTLTIGKKFDPAPVEAAIAARSALLQDVLVFGNGKPYAGALLFRSAQAADTSDDQLLEQVLPEVERVNRDSEIHARISRGMLIPVVYSESSLEKSSKGTILRGKAEERYRSEIESAYDDKTALPTQWVRDDQLESVVTGIIRSAMGSRNPRADDLDPQTDLFAYGVDSVACLHIRNSISSLLHERSPGLPITIVQEAGTIKQLSQTILNIRNGKPLEGDNTSDPSALMQNFVEQYSQLEAVDLKNAPSFSPKPTETPKTLDCKVVLITGSTGTLGSHLLAQLLEAPKVSHIHLLLRGSTPETAKQRMLKILQHRKLAISSDFESKATIHTCNLSDQRLGFAEKTYQQLAGEVDLIYHLAWAVDFTLPLSAFKQHFAGLQSLLHFTASAAGHRSRTGELSPPHFIFCSSTAAVSDFPASSNGIPVPERILTDPKVSRSGGYARSKWTAENICRQMVHAHPELGQSVRVVRVGQLSGDTVHGIWNEKEAYPLMLGSAKATGCLPDLPSEGVAWLPVDKAAAAFVELGLEDRERRGEEETQALHVLNQDRTTSWRMLLDWIRSVEPFEVVSAPEWLRRLEDLRNSHGEGSRESTEKHPALMLLDFWKEVYDREDDGTRFEKEDHHTGGPGKLAAGAGFEMQRSKEAMPVLSEIQLMDQEYALKLWNWIKDSV